MGAVVVVAVVGAVLLACATIWPPKGTPERWRAWTRPLRRRVRTRHYRL